MGLRETKTISSNSFFAVSLWNGMNPILKEYLFGLTPHGEETHDDAVCGTPMACGWIRFGQRKTTPPRDRQLAKVGRDPLPQAARRDLTAPCARR
jgi:hypothetical protein